MGRPIRRTAGGLAAFAVMAGGMLAFAPQAGAAPVNTTVKCDFSDPTVRAAMGEDKTGPQPFTVTGPATGEAGKSIKLTIDPGVSPASSPLGTKVKITPTVTFTAKYEGGSATVTAVGATATLDLVANVGIDVPSFQANVSVPQKATGKVDLLPKGFALKIEVLNPELTLNVPCAITDTSPPVAYSVTVPAASTTGGSTSSGSTTSGSTTSGSTTSGSTTSGSTTTTSGTTTSGTTTGSGTLPKTGPLDDALSMGLLGGTVGLLGIGGVLLATRRVRASRNA